MSDMTQAERRQKILAETAQIHWQELQPFFAKGQLIAVDASLDLIDVALEITDDNTAAIQHWMTQQFIGPVSETQAKDWLQRDPSLWAVVIAPWVLVQEKRPN